MEKSTENDKTKVTISTSDKKHNSIQNSKTRIVKTINELENSIKLEKILSSDKIKWEDLQDEESSAICYKILELINHGANINLKTINGIGIIDRLVKYAGNPNVIQTLTKLIDFGIKSNSLLLSIFISQGDIQVIQKILDNGFEWQNFDTNCWQSWEISEIKFEILDIFLNGYINLSDLSAYQNDIFIYACYCDNIKYIQLLMQYDIDYNHNLVSENISLKHFGLGKNLRALKLAINNKNYELAAKLINKGALVIYEKTDNHPINSILHSYKYNDKDIAIGLFESAILNPLNLKTIDNKKQNILFKVVEMDNGILLNKLLKTNIDINLKDKNNQNALEFFIDQKTSYDDISFGDEIIIKSLLDQGLNIDNCNYKMLKRLKDQKRYGFQDILNKKQSVLYFYNIIQNQNILSPIPENYNFWTRHEKHASKNDNKESISRHYKDHKKEYDTLMRYYDSCKDKYNLTQLFLSQFNFQEKLQLLDNTDGLLIAANGKQGDVLIELLKSDKFQISENVCYGDNEVDITKLLQFISKSNLFNCLKYLIDKGVKTKSDPSLLVNATKNSNLYMIKLLLANGADINAKSTEFYQKYDYPILQAVRNKNFEILQYLHKKGANLSVDADYDKTPLLIAVKNKDYNTIEYLLANGVSILEKSQDGHCALGLATYYKDKQMIEYLLTKGSQSQLNDATWIASFQGDKKYLQYIINKGGDIIKMKDSIINHMHNITRDIDFDAEYYNEISIVQQVYKEEINKQEAQEKQNKEQSFKEYLDKI